MPDTIFLFTDRYPYGAGETFVDTELKADVASKYDICVVPFRASRTKRELPSGAMLCKDVVRAPLYSNARHGSGWWQAVTYGRSRSYTTTLRADCANG